VFDAVIAVNTYTKQDAQDLVEALDVVKDFIFISSSAVYPETLPQPFTEEQECGHNAIWGAYGWNKLEAENWLREHVPQAYILRPPYIYGPMETIYRAPFAFECAQAGRPFCLPGKGDEKLQFFHVEDLCRFMEILLERKPDQKIWNVGNPEAVSVLQWVKLCYEAAGTPLETVCVHDHPQRSFFPFHEYEYFLDVTKQASLMPELKPLAQGIREAYAWYRTHQAQISRRPFTEYIDTHILP
jgi:dTDP-glucose 4,6-dehydratase